MHSTAIFIRCFKHLLLMLLLAGFGVSARSQQVNHTAGKPKSKQLKNFIKLLGEANVAYIAPEGFK